MKYLITAAFLFIGFQTQATTEITNTGYTLVKCAGPGFVVQVFNLADNKQAQLVVQNITRGGAVVVYNNVVQPMTSEGGSQMFLSQDASLRVFANGRSLKGFLNLHREQPGVGQLVDCDAFAHIMNSSDNVQTE